MSWWSVLDWKDQKTVRLVGTSGFVPLDCIGLAPMVAPSTPAPEASMTMQVVNGVMTTVVDPAKVSQLMPGLKLF